MPMGDPVSVTGTAVGVMSLGIQVCQGLVKYYQGWEVQDKEIKETLENLSREQEILQSLHGTFRKQQPGFSTSKTEVETCILQTKSEFMKLEGMLHKCQQTSLPSDTWGRIDNVKESLLYPFRRDTVCNMKSVVTEIGRVLALAIHHLQLELSYEQRQELTFLLNTISDQKKEIVSTKAMTEDIDTRVTRMNNTVAQMSATNTLLKRRVTATQARVSLIKNTLNEISTDTKTSTSVLSSLEHNSNAVLSRVDSGFRATHDDMQDIARQLRLLQVALVGKPKPDRPGNKIKTRTKLGVLLFGDDYEQIQKSASIAVGDAVSLNGTSRASS
ncbi:MAG: hypothetical protein M1822_007687 [Bathelium mastoideum]|nr:MAG: hypothetical protein M1822_007687 [Bathelium mastoideum]